MAHPLIEFHGDVFYFVKGEKPSNKFKHQYQEFTYTSLRVDIKKLSKFIKEIELNL